MTYYLQLLASILLDALFGDPRWFPHPVRGIGRVITWSETFTRSIFTNLYLAGFLIVFFVLAATTAATIMILLVAGWVSLTVEQGVAVLLLYTTIAARDLLRHSDEVYAQLKNEENLANARIAVGYIVGRDTAALNREGVCRATIETVAENMVDGITAPLFYAVLAGSFAPLIGLSPISCSVVGAFLYKAVNTMDSMIAYKNERYLEFGRVAARLDDAVNFLPARLSGICLIIAAFFLKLDYRGAAAIFQRDRLQHSSPNAGHTEAAAAGALGLRLGGPSIYFDKTVEKPYIGDAGREPVPADIKKTNRLVIAGAFVFVILLIGLRILLGQ